MNVSIHYLHFCNVISHGPATDCVDTIAMVMKLSGGTTDPNQISVWWNQWQALKQAMKENHPMVKLAAALCPADPQPAPLSEVDHIKFIPPAVHDVTMEPTCGHSVTYREHSDNRLHPKLLGVTYPHFKCGICGVDYRVIEPRDPFAGLEGLAPLSIAEMDPPGKSRVGSDPSAN